MNWLSRRCGSGLGSINGHETMLPMLSRILVPCRLPDTDPGSAVIWRASWSYGMANGPTSPLSGNLEARLDSLLAQQDQRIDPERALRWNPRGHQPQQQHRQNHTSQD